MAQNTITNYDSDQIFELLNKVYMPKMNKNIKTPYTTFGKFG